MRKLRFVEKRMHNRELTRCVFLLRAYPNEQNRAALQVRRPVAVSTHI